MHNDGTALRLSATDIANHLACRHLTQLDRAVAEGRRKPPAWRDPALELVRERGLAHERAYVEHLRASGLHVVDLRGDDGRRPDPGAAAADRATAVDRTIAAMRGGADAIVQAELGGDRWIGRADVLLRIPQPSDLAEWSYEVVDTKLAQETRGGTVLQLCLYSDLVADVQGRAPELMHVVKPAEGFARESFRLDDFGAYYRLVQRRLEGVIAAPPSNSTYPDPVAHCDICRWRIECDTRRHADDNLCLVAGIRPLHIGELERQGIHTLQQFAEEPATLREKPARGNTETFARAQGQARIQLKGRKEGRPLYELLPQEPGLGLSRLPEPDAGDIFFDIESDQVAGDGGLEYLLGAAFAEKGTRSRYRALWALNPVDERKALEGFIDFVMDRWEEHPGMHIYHFSPYEPAAIKRLIGKHGTREAEVDRLLRAERFVDLLAVTRHGVRASVESYSLKSLEQCFGFTRALELPAAGAALRRIAWALELTGPGDISADDRGLVESYNRDDCLSTAALRDWLEERRGELEARDGPIARPDDHAGDASEAIQERAADVQLVFDRLTTGLPEDRTAWGPAERARWLLAHQLEYFHREDKCAWWEFFRIHELGYEELLEERKAISGLRFVEAEGGTAKAPVHRYTFPEQEATFDEGDELHEVCGDKVGKVAALDLAHRTLDIIKHSKAIEIHPKAVMVNEHVTMKPVDGAFLEFAASVARHGVDDPGAYSASRDLLLRNNPRLHTPAKGPLRRPGENIVDAAVRLAQSLDNSILPIQGPPGTGKTYTGARMIVALASGGKRIGVTAVSHKVIRNLLREVMRAAAAGGASISAIHKVSRLSEDAEEGIEEATDNAKTAAGLRAGKIAGGTTWFWSRDDMIESVDYLFIDEAGQMSLAHALAAGRSARNVVLLGDPQQLEQPQRGAHPEGAEVAALVHVLGGGKTIADESGLFLDETWRLHPAICRFTSELFYEGRLRSRPGLERQALSGDGIPFAGSGLFFVPVVHTGNQNSSPEEAEAVARIARSLLAPGVKWTDSKGVARRIGESDVLVVAPYNAQVAALIDRLPRGVRVGTVDKFQGQQAPVVIYSMTSSSAEDAPRGMRFLYNPNRLNVATSRAQCISILVATRRLLEPECSTPEQMRWANGLCRYRELATEVRLS
ncbi:MAG: TM0106 family RecB-like putative nuclease [Spirochaetia bacterium]